jgi:hypothetical protein
MIDALGEGAFLNVFPHVEEKAEKQSLSLTGHPPSTTIMGYHRGTALRAVFL